MNKDKLLKYKLNIHLFACKHHQIKGDYYVAVYNEDDEIKATFDDYEGLASFLQMDLETLQNRLKIDRYGRFGKIKGYTIYAYSTGF